MAVTSLVAAGLRNVRSLGLALLALAFTASPASPASAAVIDIEEHFCGCDPSSGDEDTFTVVVTAAAGEHNVLATTRTRRDDGLDTVTVAPARQCRVTSRA